MRDRYQTDPIFRQAVDVMWGLLEKNMLTTEDIARAAVLAAQIYAEHNHAPVMIQIAQLNRGHGRPGGPYRNDG